MKQKTAMTELLNQLEMNFPAIKNGNAIDRKFWLRREYSQTIETFAEGFVNGNRFAKKRKHQDAKEYFTETFESEQP